MLVLSRRLNESLVINDNIVVTVVEVNGDKVRLGFTAPKDVPIHRQEVYEAMKSGKRVGKPDAVVSSPRPLGPTVAIVGASTDRRKFGNKSVRAHLAAGFDVYPVHPSAEVIEGCRAYPNIRSIPVPITRVSMYLPPEIALKVLPEIAGVAPAEVWFNPGADTPEVLDRARELGLNVVPACSIVALGLSPDAFGA